MDNNNEVVIHEIIPRFNFIYELFMPTGRKIKNTIFLICLFTVGYIVVILNKYTFLNYKIMGKYTIFNIISIIAVLGLVISFIKLIVHIVLQYSQYKNITFKFYSDHMTYEDNFLNQHRKNIEYSNIKEVEIRRTIWDRILGFGVIVIYTNAENEYSNGLVIFGIKNPKEHYDIIDNLIHSRKVSNDNNDNNNDIAKNSSKKEINNLNNENMENKTHEEFLEELKKIQK